ncbi:MAG: hypothetical protein WKF75_05785 [Singulisphaera sp.]
MRHGQLVGDGPIDDVIDRYLDDVTVAERPEPARRARRLPEAPRARP